MLLHAPAFWRFCTAKITALETGSRKCCVCLAAPLIPLPGLLQPTPGRCSYFLPSLWVCLPHTRVTSRSSPHRAPSCQNWGMCADANTGAEITPVFGTVVRDRCDALLLGSRPFF